MHILDYFRSNLSNTLIIADVQVFKNILRFQGRLIKPDVDAEGKIRSLARRWGLTVKSERFGNDIFVEVYRKPTISVLKIPPANMLLFLVTCATTLFVGAIHAGVDPFTHPELIYRGIPFSATLMLILLIHEGGHYYLSLKRNVITTYPFFIPFPSIFGTLGAVIATRSPIPSRKALFDIGAAGPICGFVVSLAAAFIGLHLSDAIPAGGEEEGFSFGLSLLFVGIIRVVKGSVPDGYSIVAHPMLLAAWIGMFVTALNLIPIGQLDGGHVIYAMLGRRQHTVALIFFVVLIAMGLFLWPGWLVWAGLVLLIRLKHPPPVDDRVPLDRRRKIIGYLLVILFVLVFPPVPFIVH
jgi:membrane-associated protease RseP (regulator of RpoE activity)